MGGQHEVPQPQLTPGHISFGIATLSRQLENDGRRELPGEAGRYFFALPTEPP